MAQKSYLVLGLKGKDRWVVEDGLSYPDALDVWRRESFKHVDECDVRFTIIDTVLGRAA